MQQKQCNHKKQNSSSHIDRTICITDFFDLFLIDSLKMSVEQDCGTTLYYNKDLTDDKSSKFYSIKVANVIRGVLQTTDDDIIHSIDLFHDVCFGTLECYNEEIQKYKDKFIGYKLLS